MAQQEMKTYLKYFFLICATIPSLVVGLNVNQGTSRPRLTKYSSSTTEPGSGSLVTPASTASKDQDKGVAVYRYVNSNSATCILLKTDALVEVTFLLHNLKEMGDSYIPEKALVDGDCKNEDVSYMRISWSGYNLVLNFEKSTGGEIWYMRSVELTVSPDLPQFHGIQTHGKPIKLYHKGTLLPTPVGKSYYCDEVVIELVTDEEDHPPPGLKGSLQMRLLHLQPFMYKNEEFGEAFECKPQKAFRDETAPIAVGSTLAVAVLMTVTGYGIFRYFKIKNVQYNTME